MVVSLAPSHLDPVPSTAARPEGHEAPNTPIQEEGTSGGPCRGARTSLQTNEGHAARKRERSGVSALPLREGAV